MTRRYRIVATFDQYDVSWEQEHAAELTDLDVEIAQGVPLTTSEFIEVAHGADAIMIDAREPITDALLDQLPNLKAIGGTRSAWMASTSTRPHGTTSSSPITRCIARRKSPTTRSP